jgi:cell wall-associated NlpC family hydrolase
MATMLLLLAVAALAITAKPAQAQSTGDAVIGEALGWYGTPYVFNGGGYYGVDCSDFTSLVYGALGVYLPDDPGAQMAYGVPVSYPGPGDLVFFSEDYSGYITHVGIATGYGTVIHASIYAGYVTETPIDYIPGYVGARSIL